MPNGKLINIAMYLEYSTFEKQGVGVCSDFLGRTRVKPWKILDSRNVYVFPKF